MMTHALWTKLGTRFTHVKTNPGQDYHWLFLPGGPGLGSEYFYELTQHLDLPGTCWHIDLPGDGSNRFDDDRSRFPTWFDALKEAVSIFDNTVLVAHSSGGMLALATPGLEKSLSGLVLLDSAPDASWRDAFMQYVAQHPVDIAPPTTDESLKAFTLKSIPYFLTEEGVKKDTAWLESLPFNFDAYDWCDKNFDSTYAAKWTPEKVNTLILAGDQDVITPLPLFSSKKDFQKDNILFVKITAAGHFPWIENLEAVCNAFHQYANSLYTGLKFTKIGK
jgi:pimeloyl-ACP methyl ester carboxylesterase